MAGQPATREAHPGVGVEGERSTGGGRGRCLRAMRTFKPGDEMAVFGEPLVVIPSGPTTKSVCSQCLRPRRPAKACTGCRAVAYCGASCQKTHWVSIHKLECRAFKRVRSKVSQDWLPTAVRAAVQLLLRWGDEGVVQAVGRLADNLDAFKTKTIWADIELQALAACTYAGWETTTENLHLASTLLCKIQTNSFDRQDSDTGDTGTFLDPTLSMVNHSCLPTALVAFAGRRAYLRAMTPLEAGDEITISYIDFTKPKIFRQHGLELYHFECTCPRCEKDLDVYQAAHASQLVPLNSFSFVPDPQTLVNPDIDLATSRDPAFRALVDKTYAACAPEARVSPEERLASLRGQWRLCQPLVRARMWAAEPLAHIFQGAINYYVEQQNYPHALCLECFVAIHSDPFKYVAPFMPWRLKGLLMIAKTLTNTAVASAQGLRNVHPGVVAALEKTDEGSLYQSILLMVLHYGAMGHSTEWEILNDSREMLTDIESLEARRTESEILREWIKNPEHPAASFFFRERALEPVARLAGLALDIIEADLEPK